MAAAVSHSEETFNSRESEPSEKGPAVMRSLYPMRSAVDEVPAH